MNDQEWQPLSDLLGNWWGGDWTRQRSEAYRVALDDFPAPSVARALTRALESGERFRPSASELRAALLDRPPRPAWDEAWALLEEAIRRVGRSVYADDFDERVQASIDWLAERDEVLAAFAVRRGLTGRPGSLGFEPVLDEKRGGVVRAALAKEWAGACAQADERVARGLVAVEPRMLRAAPAGQSGGGMGEVVDGLRPRRELEAGEATS